MTASGLTFTFGRVDVDGECCRIWLTVVRDSDGAQIPLNLPIVFPSPPEDTTWLEIISPIVRYAARKARAL